MEYGGNEVVVDIAAMKTILEVEAPFTDKSQVNKMGDIDPIAIFRIENVWYLEQNSQFVEEIAILPMALFVNALRLKSISPDSQSGYRKSVNVHSKSEHIQKSGKVKKLPEA
jgi:hypothetical protein